MKDIRIVANPLHPGARLGELDRYYLYSQGG